MFDLLVKENRACVCVFIERLMMRYSETFVSNAALQS